MRWLVHGTDGVTGERVVLALEGVDAAQAVGMAHGKGIVVLGVKRLGWGVRVRRWGFRMACFGVVVLMGVSAWLWNLDREERGIIEAAGVERGKLAATILADEGTMKRMEVIGASRESIRLLDAARTRAQGLEGMLVATKAEAAGKGALATALAGKLAAAEERLRAGEAERGRLTRALAEREGVAEGAVGTVEEARAKLAGLEAANKEMAGEVEILKGQLLVMVAKPAGADSAVSTDGDVKAQTLVPMRWALRTTYAAAADFVAMHFEKESMQTLPIEDGAGGEGAMAWTATAAGNAASVRVVYDRKKERVYGATLSVSLAADGPKERLGENMQLVGAFMRAFAPGVKDGDGRVQRVVEQLAGKDATERVVWVGADVKLSVWNNGMGMFTWRAESVGNELE